MRPDPAGDFGGRPSFLRLMAAASYPGSCWSGAAAGSPVAAASFPFLE